MEDITFNGEMVQTVVELAYSTFNVLSVRHTHSRYAKSLRLRSLRLRSHDHRTETLIRECVRRTVRNMPKDGGHNTMKTDYNQKILMKII